MLVTLDEATRLIEEGRILHIAGDLSLLSRLPKGKWIGGTTPYLIAKEGGIFTKDKLYVDEFDFAEDIRICTYGRYNVFQILEDCFDNGFTLMVLPYGSDVAASYAREAPDVDELLMHPVAGWVSGSDLNGEMDPRAFDGTAATGFPDKAVAMHVKLPADKSAFINIVNIFEDDKTDPVITFNENDLSVKRCSVNGQDVNFAEYIKKHNIDPRLPLVADYNGVYINTSIMAVEADKVSFYAPVFRNIEYRFAVNVSDYVEAFKKKYASSGAVKPVFSCNCILNYTYGELEGKKTPPFAGPVSFGEVGYQLLNQTLVYLEISG